MPKVRVRNNNVESALRVFKKKCADIVWEYRQREHYVPQIRTTAASEESRNRTK